MFRPSVPAVLTGFVVALLGSVGQGADSKGHYQILGRGTTSCGSYLEARRTRDVSFLAYEAWLTGYVTAVNLASANTEDISRGTDLDGLLGWLDNWCQTHPTSSYASASEALVSFLRRKRTTAE